jgi:predicted AlkP superfamily phosphohydrolase/phosphomutase
MMGKRQVIVLGVDALDAHLLESLSSTLPNLSALRKVPYTPIFPPDSVPAWTTIQTGLPPERHRLMTSGDYLRLSTSADGARVSPLKGRTFYDQASAAGKQVVVVNPFLAYPAWPVRGLMVSGPAFATGEIDAWPREAAAEWRERPVGGRTADPTHRTRSSFLRQSISEITELAQAFLGELHRRDWDCAFLTLLSLDRIKHFFWRFCDADDPDYPGMTEYSGAIAEGYAVVDSVVGAVCDAFPDAAFLVLSDHGHGRRPKQLFELAEWLRRRGLLHAASPWSATAMVERTKRTAVTTLSRLHLEDVTRLIAKAVPRAAELKDSSFAVSRNLSRVEVCPFGRNNFGGLRVNVRDPSQRRELAERLASELDAVMSPSGQKVINCTRLVERADEDRAAGLADLEIELHPDYGVGTDLYGGLFSVSPYRRHISGGHSVTAAMLIGGPVQAIPGDTARTVTSMDVVPTVVSLLGLGPSAVDSLGRPFLNWECE